MGWVPARCGLAIVDVDVVHNGDISFSEVTDRHVHAMQHGIITLSQGYHLVFKDRPEKPTPFVNNFAQGIDLRGNGGYLVAAVGYWSKAPFVYQPEWETSGGASEDWELIPECFAAAPARNRNGVTAGDYFERGQVLTELKRLSLLRGCDPALAEEWAWGYETQLAEHIQSMSAHDVGRIAARIVVKSSRLGHVHGVEGARWMEAVWHTVLRAVPTARWPRARNEWEELLRWQLNRDGATNRIRSVI